MTVSLGLRRNKDSSSSLAPCSFYSVPGNRRQWGHSAIACGNTSEWQELITSRFEVHSDLTSFQIGHLALYKCQKLLLEPFPDPQRQLIFLKIGFFSLYIRICFHELKTKLTGCLSLMLSTVSKYLLAMTTEMVSTCPRCFWWEV